MQITWYDVMTEVFGLKLTEERASKWLSLLSEPDAIPDVSEDELCNVLRWARQKREHDKIKKLPTIEMLIMWVRWYRKEQRIERYGASHTSCPLVTQIQSEMRDAHDHAARWDLMCDGAKTVNQCHELDAWARQEWSDWEQSVSEIKRNMSALRKRVWRRVVVDAVENEGKTEGAE